jgi:hypothetical protein
MAIRERDYMKRPPDDDGQNGHPSDSKPEELVRKFLQKYPRFLLYLGIGFAILIVIAVIISKLSDRRG